MKDELRRREADAGKASAQQATLIRISVTSVRQEQHVKSFFHITATMDERTVLKNSPIQILEIMQILCKGCYNEYNITCCLQNISHIHTYAHKHHNYTN